MTQQQSSKLFAAVEELELLTLTATLSQAHEDYGFDLVRTDLLPRAIKYRWYQNICGLIDRGEIASASRLLAKRLEAELHVHRLIEGERRTKTVGAPDDTNTLSVSGLGTEIVPGSATRRRLVIPEWAARFDVMLPKGLATSWLKEPALTFDKGQRSDALQFWLVVSTDQWGSKTRIQFVGEKSAQWQMA